MKKLLIPNILLALTINNVDTKIANKYDYISVSSKYYYAGIVRLRINCNNELFRKFYVVIGNKFKLPFKIDKICRNAKAYIDYFDYFDYYCYPNSFNKYRCLNFLKRENYNVTKCFLKSDTLNCIFDYGKTSESNLFAIRPDHIEITGPKEVKAGKEFNITINYYDYKNNKINYYQNVSFDKTLQLKYSTNEKYLGKLNIIKQNKNDLKLTYSESGKFKICLNENKYDYFAIVNKSYNYIKGDCITINSKPYKFLYKISDNNYSFMDNDFNQTGNIYIKSYAVNKNLDITKNFNGIKDIEINFSDNIITKNDSGNKFIYNLKYNDGVSVQTFKFNTGKNYDTYSNPKEIEYNINNYNGKIKFYYAKVDFKIINDKITPSYYIFDNKWKKINLNENFIPYFNRSVLNIIDNKVIPKRAKFSTKIHFKIPSYLWYHPLAKDYKDPSSTNLDCLTHPCIVYSKNSNSKGWSGVGKSGIKYSETNRTGIIKSEKFNSKIFW